MQDNLQKLVPFGLLVTRKWLQSRGLKRHRIDNLVKSGQVKALVSGVYARSETDLQWQGVVSSLQRMGFDLVVGGLSSLELQGLAHFLPFGGRKIHVYGFDHLPSWANRLGLSQTFAWHGNARLWDATGQVDLGSAYTKELPWGTQFAMKVSVLERAICELLVEVPTRISFEHADQLMQGLSHLSPRRLQEVLERFKHVKAKRLLCWLAERQGHRWFTKLDLSQIDLGSGKRVVAERGRLDKTYEITVPEEMYG